MGRTSTTAELSELIRKRLNRRTPYWADEVLTFPVASRNAAPRVDFMAFYPKWPIDLYQPAPLAVEHGAFECYEVKSCITDFESGHGLNFVGDRNYLVCETGLADRLRDEQRIPKGVSVLVPDSSRTRLVTRYENRCGDLRRQSSTALLLCLLMRMNVRGGTHDIMGRVSMDNFKPEVVGFEYHHSIDGTGWPDAVVLEADDGNEREQRRYLQNGPADAEALLRLAEELERRADSMSSGCDHANTCREAASIIRSSVGTDS